MIQQIEREELSIHKTTEAAFQQQNVTEQFIVNDQNSVSLQTYPITAKFTENHTIDASHSMIQNKLLKGISATIAFKEP